MRDLSVCRGANLRTGELSRDAKIHADLRLGATDSPVTDAHAGWVLVRLRLYCHVMFKSPLGAEQPCMVKKRVCTGLLERTVRVRVRAWIFQVRCSMRINAAG